MDIEKLKKSRGVNMLKKLTALSAIGIFGFLFFFACVVTAGAISGRFDTIPLSGISAIFWLATCSFYWMCFKDAKIQRWISRRMEVR